MNVQNKLTNIECSDSSILETRLNKILNHFEQDFFTYLFDENEFLKEIIFFGSFIKGHENEKSDIDMILVVNSNFLESNSDIERLETLLSFHQDIQDGLISNIPLDIKLQEFYNEDEQYGLTYYTGNAIVEFYSFIKHEIGQMVRLTRNGIIQFEQI